MCELIEKQIMKVQQFFTIDLDIFDTTMVCNLRPLIVVGEGGLKLDPKHNTNYNKFLTMGTLQTYQNNIIT